MVPMLPPGLEVRYQFNQSNDFLGRGGSVDDFRTQQIIIAADFAERWTAVVDHSVLTLTDPAASGRIDQFSASLGYRLLQRADENGIATVTAGLGVRGIGDFEAGKAVAKGLKVGRRHPQMSFVAQRHAESPVAPGHL